ncbi:hypothetical protein ACFO7V_06145 [Glutamicibacter bergerei]|uniref:O-antigen/teichoic acid export membrane protein n=1 Tax=Glutamicibacter bergerei TaxID=256702 RepID=A0ABV9MIH9_9MICC|nr:hypothetical protein [Micrococcaceae bacterium]
MSAITASILRIRGVGTATIAQASQSAAGFIVTMLAARLLGLEALGLFSLLYGAFILATGIVSGFVGDSLMVLDRFRAPVRAALLRWFAVLIVFVAAASFGFSLTGTQLTPGAAALYALAAVSYVCEDLVRRNHMATLTFGRIVVMDLAVLLTSAAVILGTHWLGNVSIETFLMAIIAGQVIGLLVGWFTLPKAERAPAPGPAAWREVASYGSWRAALQGLRPGQLTLTRLFVIALISLTAAGSLEAARIYAAPAMLLVSGVCSYLFASMARNRTAGLKQQLRTTDQAVTRLVLTTVACTICGLLLLPWGGPLITGHHLSGIAVSGWLVYSMAVAMSTPYGLLASVLERARSVFVVRFLDSLLSLILVAAVILVSGDYRWVPWAAALGALAGGFAIRRWVLGALVHEQQDSICIREETQALCEAGSIPEKEERFS